MADSISNNIRARRGVPFHFPDGLRVNGVDFFEYLYQLTQSTNQEGKTLTVVTREYLTTSAGQGYASGDRIIGCTSYDTSTSPAGESTVWFNETTRSAIAAPTASHLTQVSGQTGNVVIAPKLGFVSEDEYIAQAAGAGYARGHQLRRYDLVSQENGTVIEATVWYNRSVFPVLKLTTEPNPAHLGRGRDWVMGDVNSPAASLDGVGEISVIAALRAIVQTLASLDQRNAALTQKVDALSAQLPPALGSSDDTRSLPVRITSGGSSGGTSAGSGSAGPSLSSVVSRYVAIRASVDHQVGDVVQCVRTIKLASDGTQSVTEVWINEVNRSVFSQAADLTKLRPEDTPLGRAKIGSMELTEGQSFEGSIVEADLSCILSSVAIKCASGRARVILAADNSSFVISAGENFEVSFDADVLGEGVTSDFAVHCIEGETTVVYGFHQFG